MRGDPALAAKALDTFARQAQVLEFKGGVMDGAVLDADESASSRGCPAASR